MDMEASGLVIANRKDLWKLFLWRPAYDFVLSPVMNVHFVYLPPAIALDMFVFGKCTIDGKGHKQRRRLEDETQNADNYSTV